MLRPGTRRVLCLHVSFLSFRGFRSFRSFRTGSDVLGPDLLPSRPGDHKGLRQLNQSALANFGVLGGPIKFDELAAEGDIIRCRLGGRVHSNNGSGIATFHGGFSGQGIVFWIGPPAPRTVCRIGSVDFAFPAGFDFGQRFELLAEAPRVTTGPPMDVYFNGVPSPSNGAISSMAWAQFYGPLMDGGSVYTSYGNAELYHIQWEVLDKDDGSRKALYRYHMDEMRGKQLANQAGDTAVRTAECVAGVEFTHFRWIDLEPDRNLFRPEYFVSNDPSVEIGDRLLVMNNVNAGSVAVMCTGTGFNMSRRRFKLRYLGSPVSGRLRIRGQPSTIDGVSSHTFVAGATTTVEFTTQAGDNAMEFRTVSGINNGTLAMSLHDIGPP